MRAIDIVISIGVVLTLVATGCGTDDGVDRTGAQVTATSSPTRISAEPDVTPSPPYILSMTSDGARAPLSPDELAKLLIENSHLVVRATVAEILPARWTTPDGERPIDPGKAHESGAANIVTPIVIHLAGPPIIQRVNLDGVIDLGDTEVVITTLGGQVGLDRITIDDPREHFEIGEDVLIGITSVDFDGPNSLIRTERGLAWNVSFKSVITPDGQTYAAGGDPARAEPLDAFVARLRNAAATLPPVTETPVVVPSPSVSVVTSSTG